MPSRRSGQNLADFGLASREQLSVSATTKPCTSCGRHQHLGEFVHPSNNTICQRCYTCRYWDHHHHQGGSGGGERPCGPLPEHWQRIEGCNRPTPAVAHERDAELSWARSGGDPGAVAEAERRMSEALAGAAAAAISRQLDDHHGSGSGSGGGNGSLDPLLPPDMTPPPYQHGETPASPGEEDEDGGKFEWGEGGGGAGGGGVEEGNDNTQTAEDDDLWYETHLVRIWAAGTFVVLCAAAAAAALSSWSPRSWW